MSHLPPYSLFCIFGIPEVVSHFLEREEILGHSCGFCLEENNLGKYGHVSPEEEESSLLRKRYLDFFFNFSPGEGKLQELVSTVYYDSELKGT